ncbi:MAG: hypothetical protein IT383_19415 [Deltaproteobacteria bacterium]|nr:hypothetical protein [Deltaproteobacteria bacterium]
MSETSHPDRDALLMQISAYLDGELSSEDEARVVDALGRDPELLAAFEAMAAARVPAASLDGERADDLSAAVLAATEGSVPATAGGAAHLASQAIDGELEEAKARRLDLLLVERPVLAGEVLGLAAASEAVRVAARAVGELPANARELAACTERVVAAVAARERMGALASAGLDGQLVEHEAAELAAGLPGAADLVLEMCAARQVGEALAAASQSAAFVAAARRAGEAALHVIAADEARAAVAQRAPAQPAARPGLMARLRGAFGGLSAPLAFAATAATLFFVLREPGSASSDLAARETAKRALFDALAPQVMADALDVASAGRELPLLADNGADVEAIDATGTTMVFSTTQSNITVIWVAESDDTQGT